ncbi:MAG: D-glycero-alpha-D-manno-heptose-1,7-bisphosphate 7-phosphatase [Burkholderiaceae bacterium]
MKAIFLDKDGTLINDVPYNIDPQRMVLSENAGEGLRLFAELGYQLIVVSNQSGIARGYFGEDAMQKVEQRLVDLLKMEKVNLRAFYYCPHHPHGRVTRYAMHCDCRKPLPGMLMQAAQDHDIDLEASWMIGDILDDVEAGNRAGCRTILLDNGNETEWKISTYRKPDLMVPDIHAAARLVAQQSRVRKKILDKSLV